MYVTPEQIQSANKANVETLLAVANTQFAAFEKLANISAGAVKSAFEDSINNTRALLGAKDVQEFVTLQNAFAQPAIEKAIAYSKSVYEVATEANTELSKVAERRVSEWNEGFVNLLDKVSKNAPAGSDVAVAAIKSMLAAEQLGVRQPHQGRPPGDRDRGSQRQRRDRDREGHGQGKKSRLSAKPGRRKARSSVKRSKLKKKARR